MNKMKCYHYTVSINNKMFESCYVCDNINFDKIYKDVLVKFDKKLKQKDINLTSICVKGWLHERN